jgi:UDP-N-acetyl-D-mannosaminuronic acid dehydrogenase
VVFINVETPVDENHIPRYEALQSVVRQLGPVLQEGGLVIVESTIAPGTMERVVQPLLEASSDRQMNQGFFLGHCPERVTPGKMLTNLRSMSRVCGGSTPEAAQVMVVLYRQIVHADLDTADVVTAELVKTVENAYRDVQIAFANEVALICEVNGADVWRVRELVNKSPYRQMHLPGAGVGGHCIPKDPWLLAYSAHGKVPLRLIPATRAVNDGMPLHVADMTLQALQEAGRPLSQARVAVLGYAYREDSDDTRSSPSAVVVARLRELGIEIMIHDPWVPEYQGDLFERVVGCDAAVMMVGHRAYHTLDLDTLKKLLRTPIVIDGRGIFDMAQMQAAGFVYRGVGRGDKTGVKAVNRVLEESIS